MTIDTRTPEGRAREVRNIALRLAKIRLAEAETELDYLILATPTGERRNALTDINILVMEARTRLDQLQSEEAP